MRARLILAVVLGLQAGAGPAHALGMNAAYEFQRERDVDLPAYGFSTGLSQGLGDYFSIGVGYSRMTTGALTDGTSEGRLEYSATSADLGAGYMFTSAVGLSGAVGYARSEVRGREGFAGDETLRSAGPTGSLALTLRPHPWVELFAGPAYSYIGREQALQGNVGVGLKLFRDVWLSSSYWAADSSTGWSTGLHIGN